jgi:hypothetical protein
VVADEGAGEGEDASEGEDGGDGGEGLACEHPTVASAGAWNDGVEGYEEPDPEGRGVAVDEVTVEAEAVAVGERAGEL